MEFNHIEQKIVNYIKRWHTGKEKAITYRNLALSLGMSKRELRNIVAHLVAEHKCLIATTSSDGYFWIQDKSDYEHARAELISRINKLRIRLDGLDLGWKEKNAGQQDLFIKNKEAQSEKEYI